MGDLTDAIYDVLAAYTGLSDRRNRAIAVLVADAVSTHTEAREAAAAEAMQEAAAQYLFTLSASSPRWGSPEEHSEHIRALPIPAPDALSRALAQARAEEREACAKIALRTMLPDDCGPAEAHGRFQQAVACCEAIRARGKEVGGE